MGQIRNFAFSPEYCFLNFSFFSINSIFCPLAGIISSTGLGALFFLFKAAIKYALLGFNLNLALTLQLPFIVSAIAWKDKRVMFFVALISILFFTAHPVGSQAFVYSTLWLIPIFVSLTSFNNIFLRSFGATFTAHAVGSLGWLYFGSIPAATWVYLTPIAFFERAVFALGLFLAYTLWNRVSDYKVLKRSVKASS